MGLTSAMLRGQFDQAGGWMPITQARALPSSIASGKPSSRQQTSSITVRSRAASTHCARWLRAASAETGLPRHWGNGWRSRVFIFGAGACCVISGSTSNTCSPRRSSGNLEVQRTVSVGDCSINDANHGAARWTCSKLSSTSSKSSGARCCYRRSCHERPSVRLMPSVIATARATAPASGTRVRSTTAAPCLRSRAMWCATSGPTASSDATNAA